MTTTTTPRQLAMIIPARPQPSDVDLPHGLTAEDAQRIREALDESQADNTRINWGAHDSTSD